MQQISFDGMTAHSKEVKFETKICPDCGKKCQSQRGCLITQIQNNLENKTSYIVVLKKVEHLSESDLAWVISVCKDYKNRGNPFSKAFYGMLKMR